MQTPQWLIKQAIRAVTEHKGTLYLVATPIGNLEDITLRALRVLREVAVIAAEDTRHTRKLLEHYGIAGGGRLTSYFDHNERLKTPQLINRLEEGQDVALVSDAGTPAVSDPGYELVKAAAARGIAAVAVPGPSAVAAAVSLSGLPTERFLFVGFLPPRASQRRRALEELAGQKAALVFYVPGRNLAKVLEDMRQVLGERQAVVARELTKVNEEVMRGDFAALLAGLVERPERARGEAVVVVSGAEAGAVEPPSEQNVEEMLAAAMAEGASLREAVRVVSAAMRLPRRTVYEAALRLKQASEPGERD
jgi:16S rRNA (cytidine1402-2'-O)-methyltransferase